MPSPTPAADKIVVPGEKLDEAISRGFYVFSLEAPAVKANPSIMYAKCKVEKGSTPEVYKLTQVDPPGDGPPFDVPAAKVMNFTEVTEVEKVTDIGMLTHPNALGVLDLLNERLKLGYIYTWAEPLMIAMNPFTMIKELYTKENINKYRDNIQSELTPHIYLIARQALDNLYQMNRNQTIIVSGESGAGKTEATKQIMTFFASAKDAKILDLVIQEAVMAGNPVLEAFGNAKTLRNNNSSRFGRFMQLAVQKNGGITNGEVKAFLLEKMRVTFQDDNERSFHIFYQLLEGAPQEVRDTLGLLASTEYKWINKKCLKVMNIDDNEDYTALIDSFKSMFLDDLDIANILSIIAGIMLLGNVDIIGVEEEGEEAAAKIADEAMFQKACGQMFLDAEAVKESFIYSCSTGADGTVTKKRLTGGKALMYRDSLAKNMYEKLFEWVIKKLNENIKPAEGFDNIPFIGMLDIFGFEVFAANGLPQFFINVTNEALQKNFTDVFFDREAQLYEQEGIGKVEMEYKTNENIMVVLMGTDGAKKSVKDSLGDCCFNPNGNDKDCYGSIIKLKNDVVIPDKAEKSMKFKVVHSIGDIEYQLGMWRLNNMDVMRYEFQEAIKASPNRMVSEFMGDQVIAQGKLDRKGYTSEQFHVQLDEMMKVINSTEPRFIRCVKPNEEKAALKMDYAKTFVQLHALSVMEALQLRLKGFSYRRPFADFIEQFKAVDLELYADKESPPTEVCEKILKAGGISNTDPELWKMGNTMVFMKADGVKQLMDFQIKSLSMWKPVCTSVEALTKKRLYRRELESKRYRLIRFQAHARKHLQCAIGKPKPENAAA
eukprot:GHVU01198306.1.p1 GENE.GHVU01198306.1~~GHVU01198306.1.p1  ORF type:complete len:828 (-),score=225.74 GHVU01198306.1:278-2761(-)